MFLERRENALNVFCTFILKRHLTKEKKKQRCRKYTHIPVHSEDKNMFHKINIKELKVWGFVLGETSKILLKMWEKEEGFKRRDAYKSKQQGDRMKKIRSTWRKSDTNFWSLHRMQLNVSLFENEIIYSFLTINSTFKKCRLTI